MMNATREELLEELVGCLRRERENLARENSELKQAQLDNRNQRDSRSLMLFAKGIQDAMTMLFTGQGLCLASKEEPNLQNTKIAQIKIVRQYTGCDLRSAKEAVEMAYGYKGWVD